MDEEEEHSLREFYYLEDLETGYQSFRIHGSFVPRRFVPRIRRFVATFDQFVPNPLDDSYPTNYLTLEQSQPSRPF